MAKKASMPANANVFPVKQAESLAERMLPSFRIQNHMYLSYGSNESTPRKNCPSVNMYHDDNQFYSPDENAIHLGSHGPLEYFKVETEADYVSGMEFLFGHENQHVRSTATIPYRKGIVRCVQVIIEYMAKKEGIPKRFRNERDYEVFLDTDLRAKNIYVSMKTLTSLCASLMNSIEDGRIERIRSLEFPGYALQRTYFRGLEWQRSTMETIPYEKLDAQQHLGLLMNVIHSLATKNIYPQGFTMAYAQTPLMDEIVPMMPYIARAVLAGKTRKMADNAVKITELLAPYIYDAVKADATQVDQMMQQMLQQLLSQIFSQLDPDKMAQLSEREEGEASEQECSVFGMSDLVIEVDDETYDKLMQNAKQEGANGPGIMIKRKNPKDEDEKSDKDDKSSGSSNGKESDKKDEGTNGSGKSKKSDKENADKSSSNGSKGESGDEGNEQNNQSGGSNQSNDSNQSGNSSSQSGDSKSKQKNSSQQGTPGDASDQYDSTRNQGMGGAERSQKEGKGSQSSGISDDGDFQSVLDAMQKAAQECRSDAEETVSTINKSTVSASKSTIPVIESTDKPITAKDVKDICSRFNETTRKYKLDQQLPTVLNARAKAFRKKNERYFKSLSTPNVTNLSSGGIDPSLIYGLTFGETNIFRKDGIDKKFDGCVYVLIDNSGSMDGNKRKEACKAAAVIEEGFKGIIPMKIVAFDYSGTVIHEVVKGWNESQKMNCCWNFACHGRNGCGNDDAKDILIAQRELLARPERKKLLIVLSDGAPADSAAVKKAVSDSRKKGVNVFGIYFEEGRIGNDAKTFQDMYQKDYVCCPLDEVDENLTKLMIKFSRS